MCYFDGSPLVAEHKLLEDEAFIGYKMMACIHDIRGYSLPEGVYSSPYQNTVWSPETAVESTDPRDLRAYGIFALKTSEDAVEFAGQQGFTLGRRYIVLPVKLWGTILEFGTRDHFYALPGYTAEYAQLHQKEVNTEHANLNS